MQLARTLAAAAVFLLATACSYKVKDLPVATAGNYRLTSEEAELLRHRLDGAEQPRLSLSMSGGGLRSALVNIGVLKALYDDKVLDDVDLVSSVSGGSYVSYWLYGLQSDDPSQPFGIAALGDERFLERTCEVVAEANFVTYPQVLGKFRYGWNTWARSREMYVNALKRTFDQRGTNGRHGAHANLMLDDLAPMVRENNVPYLVINATTRYRRKTSASPGTWNERLYEFTPLHYGAFEPEPGRTLWAWNDREYPLVEAVSASGAAITVLKKMFEQPYPEGSPTEVAFLGDGGWSENLGASAALLRGTRAHIVIDGEYDAKGQMGAWTSLTGNLQPSGFKLSMERDRGKKTGLYRASATRNDAVTPVYYVKMEIPDWLRRNISEAVSNGEFKRAKQDAYDPLIRALGPMLPTGPNGERQWQCKRLRSVDVDVQDLMFYVSASHIRFRESKHPRELIWQFNPPWVGSLLSHKFPETTTADQSMALDEAMAYIALGYMTAKDRVAEMLAADGVVPVEGAVQ